MKLTPEEEIYNSCGIYYIVNIVNNKIYIGMTRASFKKRIGQHKTNLRSGKHIAKLLQKEWFEYGEKNFNFSPFEIIDKNEINEIYKQEQYWVEFYDTTNPEKGYNGCIPKKGTSGLSLSKALVPEGFIVTFPDGKEEKIQNLLEFCEKYSLTHSCMCNVARGRNTSHKNFKLRYANYELQAKFPPRQLKTSEEKEWNLCEGGYIVTFPDGSEHAVKNLSRFANKHNLRISHLIAIAKGQRVVTQGYKCKYANLEKQVPPKQPRQKTTYKLTSPTGEVYITQSLTKFAEEHDLCAPSLSRLVRGLHAHHKNWKCEYVDKPPTKDLPTKD